MPTIYIDGKPFEIQGNENLLESLIELGLNVPYFCWHPALGSVGACRQCAITQYKDENDAQGRIVMSCMTPATDGMRISVDDAGSKAFRASVIEWMMTNHPHDCPVCDEGGECHLQDMTLMTGHDYRRYRFDKKTYHESGPRAARQPRDESLYRVLSLRALLQGLRRRRRSGCVCEPQPRATSGGTKTARSRANSAATWSRCARPACSPTRRSRNTSRAGGT